MFRGGVPVCPRLNIGKIPSRTPSGYCQSVRESVRHIEIIYLIFFNNVFRTQDGPL